MKKIIRLTESDLARIVKRVINERSQTNPYSGKFPSIDVLKNFKGSKYESISMDPKTPTKMFKITDLSVGDEPYMVDVDVTELGLNGKDINGKEMTVEFNCNDKSMKVKSSYFNQHPKQINVYSKRVSDRMWDLYCKSAKQN